MPQPRLAADFPAKAIINLKLSNRNSSAPWWVLGLPTPTIPAISPFPVSFACGCCKALTKSKRLNRNISPSLQREKSVICIMQPKWRCRQGHSPDGDRRNDQFLCFYRLSLVACILWLVAASLQSARPTSSNLWNVCVPISLPQYD